MSNQEDIIFTVHEMDMRELMDLIIEKPFFLTDSYYVQIGQAIRARYAEMRGDTRRHYSF
jgi:hypothetical protein